MLRQRICKEANQCTHGIHWAAKQVPFQRLSRLPLYLLAVLDGIHSLFLQMVLPAATPSFATDQPDSFYQASPQPRARAPQQPPAKRTSAYDVYVDDELEPISLC
jgi:hypothetical protein